MCYALQLMSDSFLLEQWNLLEPYYTRPFYRIWLQVKVIAGRRTCTLRDRDYDRRWKSTAVSCSYYGWLLRQGRTDWFNLPLTSLSIPLHCAPLGLSHSVKSFIFSQPLWQMSIHRQNIVLCIKNNIQDNKIQIIPSLSAPLKPLPAHSVTSFWVVLFQTQWLGLGTSLWGCAHVGLMDCKKKKNVVGPYWSNLCYLTCIAYILIIYLC